MRKRRNDNDALSFDFSSLERGDNPEEQVREVPRLSLEPACFEAAEEMAKNIDWAKDYFCFVPGSFIFGDFIEALCFVKHLNPSAIYLTTLGMSQDNIDSIVNLIDYLKCKKVNLLVSHYFAGVERHGLVPYMQQEFSGRPIDVAVLQSHCKIAVIRSDKGDGVICGSANLSSSQNVEQFCILHDPAIADYVQNRLDNIMRRFTIIRGMEGHMDWKANNKNTGKNAWYAMNECGEKDGQ